MKIEKKLIEVETVTFDVEDVAVVEKALDIIIALVDKTREYSNYVTTVEEDDILDFAERIHRQYRDYINN